MRRTVICMAIVLAAACMARSSRADFYSYVDPSGVVHITNVPSSNDYTWMMPERGRAGGAVNHGHSGGSYEDMIYLASMKYGVDPPLVKAIVKAESDFDPFAVSEVGARGLMQLMPETARLMGVKNIHDPAENIEGGTRYLSRLLERFDWKVPMAVAAYNAGETAVARYGDVPPFDETREFVRRVLHYYKLYAEGGR